VAWASSLERFELVGSTVSFPVPFQRERAHQRTGGGQVMRAAEDQDPTGGEHVAWLVLSLGAAGEIGVGAAVLVFPSLLGTLLDAPLDEVGLLVARMLGSAILALGTTWWLSRRGPGGLARCTTGFLIYNLGLGALFLLHALRQAQPTPLPWVVGVVHVLLGLGLGAAVASTRPVLNRAR
jgi:hypothetical protein